MMSDFINELNQIGMLRTCFYAGFLNRSTKSAKPSPAIAQHLQLLAEQFSLDQDDFWLIQPKIILILPAEKSLR